MTKSDEIEIARVTFSTPTRDVFVLTERRGERGRVYRMLHEDVHGSTQRRIRLTPASSKRRLTVQQIIAMLESACFAGRCRPGNERFNAVIWGTLQLHLEHGCEHADECLFLLNVTSEVYPQLGAYFAERVSAWCLANCAEDVDCRKVVSMDS